MNYYTSDLEWKIDTAEIICASIYGQDGKIAEVFETVGELLTYIFSEIGKEKQNVIYMHYGGGSDFLFLLREIVGRKNVYLNEKEFFQANSRIISFTCYHHGKKYQFRDSYSILPSSLQKLAQSFISESKIENSANLQEMDRCRIKKQCQNDARLLYRIIERFMNILNLEELQLTAASQALLDMKQRADFSQLMNQNEQEYNLFQSWFFGGHVDVYRRFTSPCYQYDIKSCYPCAMIKWGCPIGEWKTTKKFNEEKAGLFIIKTKAKFWNPFFGFRANLKTYWVNSDDPVLVTDIELRKLIELGKDFKIIQGYEWKLDWNFFKPFVTYWFNFRKLGQAQKEIGKIFLNAGGYGKFAIKRERETLVFGKGADYYLSGDYEIGIKKIWKNFDYSHIEIASRITAGGRINLFNAQNEIGIENLCYSDTDSVHSKNSYFKTGNDLGNLTDEGTYKKAYYLGNKFYGLLSYDGKFKGVLKGFPEQFSEQAYKNALAGKIEFKYSKNQLMKFKSSLRKTSDFVTMNQFIREIKSIEIKRKLLSNGIDTLPYTLEQGELK